MTSDITCQRCGGIAIRSPLCGSCAYTLGVPAWERIKMRADQIVTDAVLDRWMDTHPANPANQQDATDTEQQQRHEDQYAFEAFQQWKLEDR